MLLASPLGQKRPRRPEDLSIDDGAPAVPSKPLTPPITATSANGPIASVPAPQVGAPSKQPILQAPQPAAPPQSVAGIALGSSPPKVNVAPPNEVNLAPPPTPQVGAPAPMSTLSGDWQAPTASAQSAPLIKSAAGGTMTPQGDAGNSLRGYESAEGGKFGGWSGSDNRSEVLRGLESISGVDSGSTYTNGVFGGGDATKFGLAPDASAQEIGAFARAYGLVANRDPDAVRKALTSSNPMLKAAAEKAVADNPGLTAPGAVSPIAGNWTAKDPAEQARLLAGQAAGTVPSGPTPQIAPPTGPASGFPTAPGPTQLPSGSKWDTNPMNPANAAGGGSAIQGYGPPPGMTLEGILGGIKPPLQPPGGSGGGGGVGGGTPVGGVGPSNTPAFPSTPSPGVGAPGDLTDLDPVQQAMRDETLRRIKNPSPYDDELWQKEVGRAKASSDETWNQNRDNLDADLAARGINWSSVAGDKLSDFNTAKSRSWDDTLTGFLSDRAKGIGAARDQSFNAGNTERNYYDDLRQQAIGNQFDVTKLQEALRQGKEGTALDWTKMGLDALGNSTGGAADLAAGSAASAGNANAGTSDLIAKWLAQYYGKQTPKPGVGAPGTANYGLQ